MYTIQLAKWRNIKDTGIELIDTTVKSGLPEFSPTWDMVTGIKQGTLTEQEYTSLYLAKMRQSYKDHIDKWIGLLSKPSFAIACYCKEGVFCHRHLLAQYLLKVAQYHGITIMFKGEYHGNR